jgi:hypothetical protein
MMVGDIKELSTKVNELETRVTELEAP